MKWGNGDFGAELYVAIEQYPDKQQYEDSLKLLKILREYGLEKKIDIIHVKNIQEHLDASDVVVQNPLKDAKLPFLVSVHACHPVSMIWYYGLEEILDTLNKYVANHDIKLSKP